MAFPTTLDDLSTTRASQGTDKLSSPDHLTHHTAEDTATQALETKVGINSSAVATSLDYLLKSTSSSNPGHKHTLANGATDLVKASASEVTTGTDDAKFATPAAVQGVKTITAVPGSDHIASGIKIVLTAHDTQAFGDIAFINSDGEAALADADAIASSSAFVMCADASISADASGNYLLLGVARDDTWAWTVGGLIYLTVTGTTGNTLSQTAPTGTDDVVQIVGVATHADRMFFNPQLVQVEHT